MSRRVYMDLHVPAAITAGLRRRGIDVLTGQEDGADRLADEVLLERASTLGRVLFTQDVDLLHLAATWQAISRPFGGVIYAHQLGCGIGTLVQDLERVLECCRDDEVLGRVVYLPLK